MKKYYKPGKNERALVFLDLKTGEWTIDGGVMEEAIQHKLRLSGVQWVCRFLKKCYTVKLKELKEKL